MSNNQKPTRSVLQRLRSTPVLAISSLVVVASVVIPSHGFGAWAVTCTSTTNCQSQINNLSAQNTQNQAALSDLQLKAESYQSAVDSLQSQINQLQGQIVANQVEQAQVVASIATNQQKIAEQKATLANDIKTTYIAGQVTPEELLATSDNLSDYIDKQEAYAKVQDTINSTLQQISTMEQQLEGQKAQVAQLISAENVQSQQVSSSQQQQSGLLSLTQSQQATYNSQVATNKAAITALQKQQAAIILAGTRNVTIPAKSGGSGGACDAGYGNGGYPLPWCNAVQDSVNTAGYFPNRECTSYAYWYFTQIEGHTDFYVTGNANQWLRTSSYATHSSPQVGSLAVETAGTYGHVAVVQALPGQTYAGATVPTGYVLVSEMNYDYEGHFRYSYSPLTKFAGYIY